MSGLLDTNILVHAVNKDSPLFLKSKKFIESMISDNEPLYLCWAVVYEFLRVSTHKGVFLKPLPWNLALQFIGSILNYEQMIFLKESDSHFEMLTEIFRDIKNVHGNLVHDCHIAVLLKENGVKTIYTCDTDFRLFPFLKAVDPFA